MRIPILCYHKVGPEQEEGRFLNIEPERLASHARFFKRRGYRFVRAADLDFGSQGKTVCLTFDDAYTSTLTYGLQALQKEGVTATIYAVSSLIGKTSEWDGDRARPLADLKLLLSAQDAGFEIGNHSVSHPKFAELGQEDQARQITEAHEAFLSMGLKPGSFCFPYGSHNQASGHAVEKAGYRIGVILGTRIATEKDNPRLLPRVPIAFSHALPMMIYRVFIRPYLP
ncbi:MAG: polysaccharide deacetylase family protein [Armatimonadetes bacterium]|nr:polysaccharide deacetylase family protein [Armatimonadota bacterium]